MFRKHDDIGSAAAEDDAQFLEAVREIHGAADDSGIDPRVELHLPSGGARESLLQRRHTVLRQFDGRGDFGPDYLLMLQHPRAEGLRDLFGQCQPVALGEEHEEPRQRRLEGWSSGSRSFLEHPSRRACGAPQDEGWGD